MSGTSVDNTLVHSLKVPLTQIPKNTLIALNAQSAGLIHNTMSGELYPPAMGTDISMQNFSGGDAVISLDGIGIKVKSGAIKNVTDMPFVTVIIVSTGVSNNLIDLTLQGVYYFNLRKYIDKSKGGEAPNVWL